MKRLLTILTLYLLIAISVQAQNTSVSATVTDAGSVVWANGTYSFNFVPSTNAPNGPFFNNGVPYTPTTLSGSLSGSGAFTQSVPSNSTITPSGSFWIVTYCPQATAACQNSGKLTITGGSQNISASFIPAALVVQPGANQTVYNTNEVGTSIVGSQIYLIGTGLETCSAVTGTVCNTWVSSGGGGGGGGVGAGAAPVIGVYFGPCPATNTGLCIQSPANTTQYICGSWTTASATVTCTGLPNSTTALVGQRAFGYSSCNAFGGGTGTAYSMASNAASGAWVNSGVTTPVTVSSETATTLTMSAMPSNNATAVAGAGTCLIVGTPDDTAAANLHTLLSTLTYCPKVFMANANYMFTLPPAFMFTQYQPCENLGTILTNGGVLGNVFLPAGFEIEGRGPGTTQIWLTPGFPESGPGCVNSPGGNSCLLRVTEARWSDIQFTGGQNAFGNSTTSGNSTVFLAEQGPGALERVTLLNWGGGTTDVRGTRVIGGWERDTFLNISGVGSICRDIASGSRVEDVHLACENSPDVEVQVEGSAPDPTGYAWACMDCNLFGSQFTGASNLADLLVQGGARIHIFGASNIQSGASTGNTNAQIGLLFLGTAGGTADIENSNINFGAATGNASNTNTAIQCNVACNVRLNNVPLAAQSSGFTYKDVVGSILYNQTPGSNIFGTAAKVSLSGKALAPTEESGQVTCSTGTATITYTGTYLFNPAIVISDDTTIGAAKISARSTTSATVTCTGASDVVDYSITPNPV